jgi:hypothetical protein
MQSSVSTVEDLLRVDIYLSVIIVFKNPSDVVHGIVPAISVMLNKVVLWLFPVERSQNCTPKAESSVHTIRRVVA